MPCSEQLGQWEVSLSMAGLGMGRALGSLPTQTILCFDFGNVWFGFVQIQAPLEGSQEGAKGSSS